MLPDLLAPGLRVVIAGTIAAWHRAERMHWYDGPGTKFWTLLHESGLVPEPLDASSDERVLDFGVGLTDLVRTRMSAPGEPPVFDVAGFERRLRAATPRVVAFVSKTAANSYARAAGQRLVRDYGAPSWTVAGIPAFVLPGPSGANNGMPLPLRIALWRDLTDALETLDPRPGLAPSPQARSPQALSPQALSPQAPSPQALALQQNPITRRWR